MSGSKDPTQPRTMSDDWEELFHLAAGGAAAPPPVAAATPPREGGGKRKKTKAAEEDTRDALRAFRAAAEDVGARHEPAPPGGADAAAAA